jgi:hypothetical protein
MSDGFYGEDYGTTAPETEFYGSYGNEAVSERQW